MNIQSVIRELAVKRPIFHAEADFQHALAWVIQEHYPDSKIRLETKVFGADTKVYLDILVYYQGKKYAIELKYKTRAYNCILNEEEFSLNNQGAQDIGRYDVLKDVQRLEKMVSEGVVDEGILIFLTNDTSYYSNSFGERITADCEFRIYESKKVTGSLCWGEQTGKGTMKGREEPITLKGNYDISWNIYSKIDNTVKGEFRYLMLSVDHIESKVISENKPKASIRPKDNVVSLHNKVQSNTNIKMPHWFKLFTEKGQIPKSQYDFRDRLICHLNGIGYSVIANKEINKDMVDIFASNKDERIVVEVRYKTVLLQTIYQGQHIHLKNQGAQDISRYDFVSDLGKIERVVKNNPGIKGYAILLTNDHLYWQSPKKSKSVDEDFHIHYDHVVKGSCAWKEDASKGTTYKREEPIFFEGSYQMKWQPYLKLGTNKNEQFQVLVVEVSN